MTCYLGKRYTRVLNCRRDCFFQGIFVRLLLNLIVVNLGNNMIGRGTVKTIIVTTHRLHTRGITLVRWHSNHGVIFTKARWSVAHRDSGFVNEHDTTGGWPSWGRSLAWANPDMNPWPPPSSHSLRMKLDTVGAQNTIPPQMAAIKQSCASHAGNGLFNIRV